MNQKRQHFSKTEKERMVNAYLSGNNSMEEIWKRYSGRTTRPHGQILRWMRQLGYAKPLREKGLVLREMSKKDKERIAQQSPEERIKDLERQLEDSQLRTEAYRRMIELAEKQLNIDIRKKLNTR